MKPSATVGELRPGAATAPTAPVARPGSVPVLTEHIEQHLMENQMLREQLLFFTSKQGGKKGKGGGGGRPSLSMPLPPV